MSDVVKPILAVAAILLLVSTIPQIAVGQSYAEEGVDDIPPMAAADYEVTSDTGYVDIAKAIRVLADSDSEEEQAFMDGIVSLLGADDIRSLIMDVGRTLEGDAIARAFEDIRGIVTQSSGSSNASPEATVLPGDRFVCDGGIVRLADGSDMDLNGHDLVFESGSILSVEGDFTLHGEGESSIILKPGSTLVFFGMGLPLRDLFRIALDGDMEFSLNSERRLSPSYDVRSDGSIDLSENSLVELSGPIADALNIDGTYRGTSGLEASLSLKAHFDSNTAVSLIWKDMDRFMDCINNRDNSIDLDFDLNVPRVNPDGIEWNLAASADAHYRGTGYDRNAVALNIGFDVGSSRGNDHVSAGVRLSALPEDASSVFRALYTGVLEIPDFSGSAYWSADVGAIPLGKDITLTRLLADRSISFETESGDDVMRIRISSGCDEKCSQNLHADISDGRFGSGITHSLDLTTMEMDFESDLDEFVADPIGTMMEHSRNGASARMTLASPDGTVRAVFTKTEGIARIAINGSSSVEAGGFSIAGLDFDRFGFHVATDADGAVFEYGPEGLRMTGGMRIGLDASVDKRGGAHIELRDLELDLREEGDAVSSALTKPAHLDVRDACIGLYRIKNLRVASIEGNPLILTGRTGFYSDNTLDLTLDADISTIMFDSHIKVENMDARYSLSESVGGDGFLSDSLGAGTMVEADRIDMAISTRGFSISYLSDGYLYEIVDGENGESRIIHGHQTINMTDVGSSTCHIINADLDIDMTNGIGMTVLRDGSGIAISGDIQLDWDMDMSLIRRDSRYDLSLDEFSTRLILDGTYTNGFESIIGALGNGTDSAGGRVGLNASFINGSTVDISLENPAIRTNSGDDGIHTDICGDLIISAERVILLDREYDTVSVTSEDMDISLLSGTSTVYVMGSAILPGSSASAQRLSVKMEHHATEKRIDLGLRDVLITNSISADGPSTHFEAGADLVFRNATPFLDDLGIDGSFKRLDGGMTIDIDILHSSRGMLHTASFDIEDAVCEISTEGYGILTTDLNGVFTHSTLDDDVSSEFDLNASSVSVKRIDGRMEMVTGPISSEWDESAGNIRIATSSIHTEGLLENGVFSSDARGVELRSSSVADLTAPGPMEVKADGFVYSSKTRGGMSPHMSLSDVTIGISGHTADSVYTLIGGTYDFRNYDFTSMRMVVKKNAICSFDNTTAASVTIEQGAKFSGTVSVAPVSGSNGRLAMETFGIDLYSGREDIVISATANGSVFVTAARGYNLLENPSYSLKDGRGVIGFRTGFVDATTVLRELVLNLNGERFILNYLQSFDLPTPNRAGYTLVGWTDGDLVRNGAFIMPLRDVTLKPLWCKTMDWEDVYSDDGNLGCSTDSESMNLTPDTLAKILDGIDEDKRLTLNTSNGSVSMDRDFLSDVGGALTVTLYQRDVGLMNIDDLKPDNVLTEFGLSDSDGEIREFSGKARIYIPIPSDWKESELDIWHIDEYGNRTEKMDAHIEVIDGQAYAVADVEHFSAYLAEHDYDGSMEDVMCIALLCVGAVVIVVEVIATRRMRRRA